MELVLKTVAASEEALQRLEAAGVIRRLLPQRHRLPVARGEARWTELYAAAERFGPHKLIAVTINRTQPPQLSWHSDAEDFLLLPHGGEAELVLTVCLLQPAALAEKVAAGTLRADDFMALKCRPEDPALSFFTMNPGFPHVETCTRETDTPPCFYVAESRRLDENHADLGAYRLRIEGT